VGGIVSGGGMFCLRTRVSAAVLAVLIGVVAVPSPPADAWQPPSTVPPGPGEAGSSGPCTWAYHRIPNPLDNSLPVWIITPEGDAALPDGGRCDDPHRPVVLFAHGYLALLPVFYGRLIQRLTSRGFAVVYPTYPIPYEPSRQYGVVDTGFQAGVADAADRIDLTRVGVVGHSFGGGMSPRLVQLAADRGWGSKALWMFSMAPHFAQMVGKGPIGLPERTRAVVVAFDRDVFVDARIGIEMYESLQVAADHKHHVMVHTDWHSNPPTESSHVSPNTILPVLTRDDAVDFYALDRNIDLTFACADGDEQACGADLSEMGSWTDGVAVERSTVDDPVDIGPPALQECWFFLNPRPCP